MKFAPSRLALLASASALTLLGSSSAFAANATRDPVVITIPPVNDGSTTARAPFPAERPRDDVKPADGQAVDPDYAPNTPSTTPLAPPPPAVAVRQHPPTEPALTPTGRSTTGAAAALDASRVAPGLKALPFETREASLADLDARIAAVGKTVNSYRDTMRDMNAESRERFKDAAADVDAKENEVHHSLKLARKADAAEWDAARAKLAADFEAYSAAATNFDAVVGLPR